MNKKQIFKFRLYIAGDTPNSSLALANIRAICTEHLEGCHSIEVVDVFRDPKRGLAEGVLLTPCLLKISPAPFRKIVGTLSQKDSVVRTLDLNLFAA